VSLIITNYTIYQKSLVELLIYFRKSTENEKKNKNKIHTITYKQYLKYIIIQIKT